MSSEDFLLKWNDHHKLFFAGAEDIRCSEEFTDVVLSAGEKIFRAHKLVLSICSPYFQGLFRKLGPEKHVIFLKDIRAAHLELLLQYMYKGEIKVQEDELVTVLNVAQSLEVRGLTENTESQKKERSASPRRVSPPPAPAAKRQRTQQVELSEEYSRQSVPVVKQETAHQAVIDVEQEQSYHGGGEMYHEDSGSMVPAEEGYEPYEEYGGEEYYGEPGADTRVGSFGENEIVCNYCNREFQSHSHLRQHLPVHTKEKKFECEMCGQKFTQSSSLNKHVKFQTCQRKMI